MADDDGHGDMQGSGVSQPPTSEFQCSVDYYMSAQLYRHVQQCCDGVLGRGGADEDAATFWHAVGLTAEGASTDAIRELEPLQSNPELALAVNAALINAHRSARQADKEALDKLKEKLKTLSKNADDDALVFAGRYFLYTDKAKQSRQCLEKIYAKEPNHVQVLVMLGWLNLQSGQSRQARQALNFFEAALKLTKDKQDIGALLGRSKYYERSAKSTASHADAGASQKKWDRALDDLNTIIVLYPSFTPAVLEKARLLMVTNQWEEALSTAERVLKVDARNIGALKVAVLFYLTRESASGQHTQARLNDLIEALDMGEPLNHALYFDVAQLVSRLANRKRPVLLQTLVLIERACKQAPSNSAYLAEQGVQLLLLGDYPQASLCFQEASKLDEGNVHALSGLIKCKVLQGFYREAKQELDFLSEIASSIGSNADLTFLHALVSWGLDGNEAATIEALNAAMSEHSKSLEEVAPGFGYFVAYNPDFVLEVVDMYSAHVGTEPHRASDGPLSESLRTCVKLLTELTQIVPGMVGGQLMLSRSSFLAGDFDTAERALATVLRLEGTGQQHAQAHMIQAQICLARENFQQCSQALEQARSLDFEVRNTPVYHLMKTKLLEASGQVDDALKVLLAAMELPGVKSAKPAAPAAAGKNTPAQAKPPAVVVALQDRISIFLELASVYLQLNLPLDAARVMSDARGEFRNTTEATRVLLADAALAVKRKEFDAAIKMLQSVPADSAYATRARMAQAEVFLVHKKNRKAYASCFSDMVSSPGGKTVANYLLLGEALMKIQEPERAIKAFEGALKLSPGDAALASKIGRALIATHDYKRAVSYYESAASGVAPPAGEDGEAAAPMSLSTRLALLHDLAELYLSLKHFEEAQRVLQQAMALCADKKRDGHYDDDSSAQAADVRSLSILADVGQAAGDSKTVVESLTQAWTLQVDILSRIRSENPDARRIEREHAAVLCYRLAEYYRSTGHQDKAQQFFNESLKYNEAHEKSRLALAKLHLINGDLDACMQQCQTLMRLDPSNREASLMLADLMFRKNEHEAATFHFQQLLEKNPDRYDALNKLIQLLRRAGKLSEAPHFLKIAGGANPASAKATFSAGLHFCRGLYSWYTNDPKTALAEFNQCRKDGEWGRLAQVNMVELYLNPDGGELFTETAEAKGDNSEQVASAERLLKDLAGGGGNDPALQLRIQVLEAYVHMASKNKARTDLALNNLMTLCGAEATRDYVPALLAMANAFVLRQEPAKARNQLKRISKMKYDPDYSQDFERSWLMLADIYIGVGKYEFAQELCKKCLGINKSSAKSWEMLGQIMEKEQSYKDAAEHYEQAWRFMNETSPTVGYKLAFNYLKAKRFVEAIDVCHKVLTAFPDYPKIRKDILAKAREALRP